MIFSPYLFAKTRAETKLCQALNLFALRLEGSGGQARNSIYLYGDWPAPDGWLELSLGMEPYLGSG
jgi:hypothetical protein